VAYIISKQNIRNWKLKRDNGDNKLTIVDSIHSQLFRKHKMPDLEPIMHIQCNKVCSN